MTKPQPVTVEAEYSYENETHDTYWQFDHTTPRTAKDRVVGEFIPLDATIHRIAAWHGTRANRPSEDTTTTFI